MRLANSIFLRTGSLHCCSLKKTHNVQHSLFIFPFHLCFSLLVFLHCHVFHLFLAVSKLFQAKTTYWLRIKLFCVNNLPNPQCRSELYGRKEKELWQRETEETMFCSGAHRNKVAFCFQLNTVQQVAVTTQPSCVATKKKRTKYLLLMCVVL